MTSAVNSAASIALAVGTESALADMAVFREGIRGLTAEIAQLAAVAKAVDISASLKKGLTGTSQSFTAEAEKANAGVAKTLSSGAGEKTGAEFGMGIRKGVNQQLDDLESDTSKTLAKIRASFSVPLGNGARATQSVAIDSASPIGQALAAKSASTLDNPAAALEAAQAAERIKEQETLGSSIVSIQSRTYAKEVELANDTLGLQRRAYQEQLALGQAHLAAMRQQADEEAAIRARAAQNARFQSATPRTQLTTLRTAQAVQNTPGADASKSFTPEILAQTGAIPALTAEVEKAGQGYTGLGGKIRQTTGDLVSNGHAMGDLRSGVRGLSEEVGGLRVGYGALLPLLAGAAVGFAGLAIYKTGKDAEYALSFISALTGQIVSMNDVLKATAGSVFTPKEGIEGLRALTQAGFDAKQALTVLPDVLHLAQVGELSVGEAAKVTASSIHGFGLSLSDVGHVGDVFVKAAASSNQSVEVISDAMRQASTAADQYKISFDQAAATIAVLEKRNIGGAQAFTEIRTALKDIVAPSQKAKDALDSLHIQAFDGKNLKDYGAILDELYKKTAGLNEKSKTLFLATAFDSRAAKGISALLADYDPYKKLLDDIGKSTGFLTRAQAELGDTSEAAYKRAASALEGDFVKAFQEASPAVRQLFDSLTRTFQSEDFVSAVSRIVSGVANLVRVISDNIGVLTLAVAAYAGFRLAISAAAVSSAAFTAIAERSIARQTADNLTKLQGAVVTRELTLAEQANIVAKDGLAGSVARVAGGFSGFLVAASAVLRVLGVIGAVVGTVITVYELLASKTDAAKAAQDNASSAMEHAIGVIRSENEAMERQIDLLDQQALGYSKVARNSAAATIEENRKSLASEEANLSRLKKDLKPDDKPSKLPFDESISAGQDTIRLGTQREIEASEREITRLRKEQSDMSKEIDRHQVDRENLDEKSQRQKVFEGATRLLGQAKDKPNVPASMMTQLNQLQGWARDTTHDSGVLILTLGDVEKAFAKLGNNWDPKNKKAIQEQNELYTSQKQIIEDQFNLEKRLSEMRANSAIQGIREKARAGLINSQPGPIGPDGTAAPSEEAKAMAAVYKTEMTDITAFAAEAVQKLQAIHRGDNVEQEKYNLAKLVQHQKDIQQIDELQAKLQQNNEVIKAEIELRKESASFDKGLSKIGGGVKQQLNQNDKTFNERFMSASDLAIAQEVDKVTKVYEEEITRINALIAQQKALRNVGDDDLAVKQLQGEIDKTKEAEKAMIALAAARTRDLEAKKLSFGAGVEQAFANYAKAAEDKSKIAEGFVTSSIDRMTGALNDFANGKKVSLKNLFKDEAADIIKVQLKVSTGGIAKQIQDAIGGPNGNGSGDGGFIGQALSVLFGGTADSTSNTWGIPGGLTSLTGGKGAPGGAGGSLGSASQTTAKDVLTFGQALRQVTASMGGGVSVGGVPLTGAGSVLQNSQLNSATSGGIIGALFGKAGNALATSWNLRGGQSALGSTTSTPGGSINNAPAGTSYDAAYAADVPIAHTGGIIGGALRRHAPVSMAHFAGAPRYHGGGIVSGEVPLIGKEGEGIFTREQMANLAPAGKPSAPIQHSSVKQTNNFIVKNAPSRQSQSQMVSNVGRVLNRRQLSRSS